MALTPTQRRMWWDSLGTAGLASRSGCLAFRRSGLRSEIPGYVIDEGRKGTARTIQPGRCCNLDGSDDRIEASGAGVTAYPFTMCGWANADAFTTSPHIVSLCDGDDGTIYLGIGISTVGAVWTRRRDGGTESTIGTSGGAVTTGAWNHVACVFESATAFRLYLNGVIVRQETAAASIAFAAGIDTVVLGVLRKNTPTAYFDGKLFDVRLYSRALTTDEIARIHATSTPGGRPDTAIYPSSLVGHWPLDEDGLEYALDRSGNGYHGYKSGITYSTFHYSGSDVPFSWRNESGYSDRIDVASYDSVVTAWAASTATRTTGQTDHLGGTDAVLLTSTSDGGRITRDFVVPALANAIRMTHYVKAGTPNNASFLSLLYNVTRLRAYGNVEVDMATLAVAPTNGVTADMVKVTPVGSGWYKIVAEIPGGFSPGDTMRAYIYVPNNDAVESPSGSTVYVYKDVAITAYVHKAPQSSKIPSQDIFGNALTYTGQVPRDPKLEQSYCGTFDGSNDYIAFPSRLTSGQPAALSVSAWVKLGSVSGGDTICGEWESISGDNRGWLFDFQTGQLRFVTSSNGVSGTGVSSLTVFAAGVWRHVAVVYDNAAASKCKLYVDGVLDNSGSVNLPFDTPATFRIGYVTTAVANAFDGSMADVRFYNSALSAADIALLAAKLEPTTAPVAHWPLQEGNGTTAYDVSGNGHHGTITNATESTFWGTRQDLIHRNIAWGFRSVHSGAYRTLGYTATQYFYVASNSTLQVGANDWWAFAFVRLAAGVGDSWSNIITKYSGTNATDEFLLYRNATSDKWQLQMHKDGVSAAGAVGPTAVEGDWIGLFVYHDNGVGIGISANGGAFATAAFTGGVNAAGTQFTIGGTSGLNRFGGDISLVAIGKSNTATFSAIRDAIYNGGTPLTYSQLTTAQKTDWGLVSWWEGDSFVPTWHDKHGSNHLTGTNMPLIPAKNDGLLAADGNPINCPAGNWHNGAETQIDFAGNVASPWSNATRRGYTVPAAYKFRDVLPSGMRKRTTTVPSVREHDFICD